ncbi:hypothetical protein PSE_0338 [Pseudovibrio sp. FO-BEG1]|nr:hypothetical protein PSE_0338 [Pseudovibrio sp. FO-BEG1]
MTIDILTEFESEDMGQLLCIATAMRNKYSLEMARGLIIDPVTFKKAAPKDRTNEMLRKTKRLQDQGMLLDAAAAKIWLHTMQTCDHPDLLPFGKLMWSQIKRGVPYVNSGWTQLILQDSSVSDWNLSGFDLVPLCFRDEAV